MSDSALRKQLVERLAALTGRQGRIEAHLQNEDRELSNDWADRAQEMENDEVLEALDGISRAEIVAIQATIERIDAGTWGSCARCGEPIGARRLEALPTTPLCLDCADAG